MNLIRSCMNWKCVQAPTISACTRNYLLGFSGLSLVVIAKAGFDSHQVAQVVALKKQRMNMPVYELKGEELTNLPWANGNLEEWLYRPVRFTGRKIHRHEMTIPSVKKSGFEGNWVFVPCVTKEAADFDPATREGLILGVGWIPEIYRSIYHRGEEGQSFEYDTFTGVVTTNEELQVGLFNKRGNVFNEQQFEVNNYYLPEMADASRLKNREKVKVACVELVNLDTPNDERDPRHIDTALTMDTGYPYMKTRAGALQSHMMPWDYSRRQAHWGIAGGLTALIALTAKVI